MKSATIPLYVGACLTACLALPSHGATLIENFEGQTAGSSTPPSGWSLVASDDTPDYVTTAAGGGSAGDGTSSGLGGQITLTSGFVNAQLPGGYLVNSTTFDLTQAISGSFDILLVPDSTFDDGGIIFGAIADGINTGTASASAGEFLYSRLIEQNTAGVHTANGLGTVVTTTPSSGVAADTWYRATFTWTPTSGTTGDHSITFTQLGAATPIVKTLTTTGFTFDSKEAQFGFGSTNDPIIVDNIGITGTLIPEPSSALLGGLGALCLLRRRRCSSLISPLSPNR